MEQIWIDYACESTKPDILIFLSILSPLFHYKKQKLESFLSSCSIYTLETRLYFKETLTFVKKLQPLLHFKLHMTLDEAFYIELKTCIDSINSKKELKRKRKEILPHKMCFMSKYIYGDSVLDDSVLRSFQEIVKSTLFIHSFSEKRIENEKQDEILLEMIHYIQSLDFHKPNDLTTFLYQELSIWIPCITLNESQISSILSLITRHLQIPWISMNEWMILYFLRIVNAVLESSQSFSYDLSNIIPLLQAFYIRIHGKKTFESSLDYKMGWRCCLEWEYLDLKSNFKDFKISCSVNFFFFTTF